MSSTNEEGLFSRLLSRVESGPAIEAGSVRAGDTVGDFELVELIGRGGMGQVWAVRQTSLGRRVALKLVLPERVSEKSLALFAREARAGGRLSHPGIVSVYGRGESDGLAWIAMELVEGAHNLRDLLDELASAENIPQAYHFKTAEFIALTADALQAAHEAGVIHRDVKPQNVLIDSKEQPKVTDFGLARITDESMLSATGDFAGTYAYMSPEQAMAKRMGIDHRTDIFSLGVTFYEMLTLRRPFDGDTAAQISEQIVVKEVPDPRTIRSRVPRELAVICCKCLEKDRSHRYDSMADLAADLRRYLTNEPILAKPPTTVQRATKWVKRHPTRSLAAAISVVAFGAISWLLAANVQANEGLRTERANLAAANTTILEEVASVKRLSALQDYEDLVAEARRMWPVDAADIGRYEAWIQTAKKSLKELPHYRATREELRATALPQTEGEQRAERESHPDYPKLVELRARQQALLQRRDGVAATLPTVDTRSLPQDVDEVCALADPLVEPGRKRLGSETLGYVYALYAVALAENEGNDGLYAKAQRTFANASFALGKDEDAVEAIATAAVIAPETSRPKYEQESFELQVAVETASSPRSLQQETQELVELPELEARVAQRRDWRFPDDDQLEARWWNTQLTKLIDELESLADDETGLLGDGISEEHGWGIGQRLVLARRLERNFAAGGEFALRWEAALQGIRETYPGLELAPQPGLVPIGPDLKSKKWEFWHIPSGKEPTRNAEGELELTGESGMVFVLLPGGTFAMGAQASEPNERNFDPGAGLGLTQAPVHDVTLSPFFLSKYEMTQGQWLRFVGRNPSTHAESLGFDGVWLLHPVESVTWNQCAETCDRLGLELPSEAQWEYAARAGTSTRWWTGDDRDTLIRRKDENGVDLPKPIGRVNLPDKSAIGSPWGEVSYRWPEFDDGYVAHAPVNTLEPNPFGLHHVIGNVTEVCRDGAHDAFYQHSPLVDPVAPFTPTWALRPGDPIDPNARPNRGGSYDTPEMFATSSIRDDVGLDVPHFAAGLRPAREITK